MKDLIFWGKLGFDTKGHSWVGEIVHGNPMGGTEV